ncbi:HPP family protein [Halothiobacillus sp. DCM-1]|uniref:HPP family protein n=1 Tax=Halothiobacillus sp. DCM-1 TaxID=3112558 RepID=UPI0032447304
MSTPEPVGYWQKWRGRGHHAPPRVNPAEIVWSGLGGFFGLLAVCSVAWWFSGVDRILVIGSIGASAVLLFGAPRSPLAQPRNLIGGHLLSACVGVSVQALVVLLWPTNLPVIGGWGEIMLAPALAVGLAIALMHATRTLHPPGGATALVAVIGSTQIHAMGYWFVLLPGLLAPLLLLLVALIFNNRIPQRQYPEFWW